MSYALFIKNREYQDEHGNPCSFESHIKYVKNYDGTPDLFDSFETITSAVQSAMDENFSIYIVDMSTWTVIETVNYEPENITF